MVAQKALRHRDFPECEHVFFWHRGDAGISNFMHTLPGTHSADNLRKPGRAVQISGHKTANMSIRYNIVAADVADEKSKLEKWFKDEKAALRRKTDEVKP
jgi:hypothetical protein